ncbi:PREDICTED: synaptophysin-like protein 2 [Cyprinodon variegatus]|uniref:synaptophysin-like protein 2 n=1 Tax=Cyprinodon variegatus TaxID=28743 RepID=UPI00074290EA|nr:PREDICTED: synaptophysin-like protein 2 [Cyprinodon variegatus]
MAQPGPHPGARTGVGARMRAPGCQAFAHGAWPGSARTDYVGSPSWGPTEGSVGVRSLLSLRLPPLGVTLEKPTSTLNVRRPKKNRMSLLCSAIRSDHCLRLPSYPYNVPLCNGSQTNVTYLQGDFSSSAEFFVCVGVFGFLYCTATLVLYLGFQHVYRQTSRGPIVDLLVTAAFAFLWLVSSSAWGKGLTDVKWATNPTHLAELFKNCEPGESPSMGRLNASVIFGFLNLILWAGNCWFIYKETPFHKDPIQPDAAEGDAAAAKPYP